MAIAGLGSHHLIVLAGAGILLDLAVQGNLVLSQQEVYQLRPDARSRINTVFIGSVFVGGAIGSALSGLFYGDNGWAGVTTLGVILSIIGFGLWCGSEALRRKRAAAVPVT
jgi:predicted MFS family arabinose efflux permease